MYPPEEVEAKRWQKIANALGNRTPKQVKEEREGGSRFFKILIFHISLVFIIFIF